MLYYIQKGSETMDNIIITIGRQYGSGGRMIGQKLAKDLNIPCYDKELLTIAAKESGFSEEIFKTMDEKPTGSFLYSLVSGTYGTNHLPLNHKLFLAQFDAIRSIAEKGSCVIVGRCADYALEDYPVKCINVFIHADLQDRVTRAIEEYGISPDKAEETVQRTDKQRASYYNFYSDKKWGVVDHYDITLDSSKLGIDNTVEMIKHFISLNQ